MSGISNRVETVACVDDTKTYDYRGHGALIVPLQYFAFGEGMSDKGLAEKWQA